MTDDFAPDTPGGCRQTDGCCCGTCMSRKDGSAAKKRTRRPPSKARLKADLRTLVRAIPEEEQGDATFFASNRLYDFIDQASV